MATQVGDPLSRLDGVRLRRLLIVAVSLLCQGATGIAHAQVDTPAAREARAALAAVQRIYGSSAAWAPWLRRLGVEDVGYELRAGDRAELGPIQWAAGQLRSGGTSYFRAPAFRRLAVALARRAEELAPVPPGQWSQECYRRAKSYAPVTPRAVQAGRQQLLDRMNELEQRLPTLRNPKDAWRQFVSWHATKALVYSDTRDPGLLDRLEARWQGAPQVWGAPELVEASLAVQSYIRLYRGYLANETQARYAAAWDELGKLLEPDAADEPASAARIATLVDGRERLGQGSALTASIRQAYSRPNVILQARTPWLQAQLAQRINDRYDVNGVYGGARSVGSGTLAATMRCQILPSSAVGQAIFRFNGTSRARTTGYSQGVSVASRAMTEIRGAKAFTLDDTGLSARRAAATANTAITYDSINAPGFRRRRAESVRQTYARRPQAEAESETAARRETIQRMDAEGNSLVKKFNETYTQLRNRQLETHLRSPEMRIRATPDVVRWECRLERPALFAAPGAPPEFEPTADVTLSIAASAMEEQCLTSLAGRQMSGEQLSKAVGDLLGAPAEGDKRGLDFSATFAAHPCDVQFADGQIRAKFYITAFDSSDAQFSAMTVDAAYNVEEHAGDLALARAGRLRVRALGEDGKKPAARGRQQTLRLAVERKLNKAFARTFLWHSPTLPVTGNDPPKLAIRRARVDAGWLQLALGRRAEVPKAKSIAARD
jgi:hypothetical protein